MISVSQAIKIIRRNIGPLGSESVDIADAVGRILAEDIKADSDLPPFDRSQMDGFAVKAADTAGAPVLLKIVGEAAAGSGWDGTLRKGEAVRIMTGAPVPRGADAVQKVELTIEVADSPQMAEDAVSILEPTSAGRYIVKRGSEIKKGRIAIRRGTRIRPEVIAGLAAFGYGRVKAGARPRLSVLATGSEIVDIGAKPGRDQIRNSNSHSVRALAERYGCTVDLAPATGDDIAKLRRAIRSAAHKADLVVITGGVSVGKYDLTKTALADIGAEILFDKVKLKPGKPTVFALLGGKPVFGLPGNPVSVAVTFELFVKMAVLLMQGSRKADLRVDHAVAAAVIKGTKGRDSYLPAELETDAAGRLIARPIAWHGSSDLVGYGRADALVFVPAGTSHNEGDAVSVIRL